MSQDQPRPVNVPVLTRLAVALLEAITSYIQAQVGVCSWFVLHNSYFGSLKKLGLHTAG